VTRNTLPVCVALLACATTACPERRAVEDTKKEAMSESKNVPDGKPSHLVVLLHGVGADAASFQGVARALSGSLTHAELLVPDGFQPFDGGGQGRQWFSVRGVTEENRPARVRDAGGEVSRWIDAELVRRGLGADKLVVVGFSQGAILAAWLAVHRAPRPLAVVMLSGRVAEGDVPSVGVGPRVLVAHGEQDRVMPVSLVEPGARVLEAWGARVTKKVYPGLGHEVDARELRDVAEFIASAVEGR
jgi:phospholipase/carboxylesterase